MNTPNPEIAEQKVFVIINSNTQLPGSKIHLNVDAIALSEKGIIPHQTVIFEVDGKQKQETAPENGQIKNCDIVFAYQEGTRTKLKAWVRGAEQAFSEYDITPPEYEGKLTETVKGASTRESKAIEEQLRAELEAKERTYAARIAELNMANKLLQDQLHPIKGTRESLPEQQLLERAKRSFEQSLIPWEEAGFFTSQRETQGFKKPNFDEHYRPLMDRNILLLMCDGEGFEKGYNRVIWTPDAPVSLYFDLLKSTLLKAFHGSVNGKSRNSLLVGDEKRPVTAINPQTIMTFERPSIANPNFESENGELQRLRASSAYLQGRLSELYESYARKKEEIEKDIADSFWKSDRDYNKGKLADHERENNEERERLRNKKREDDDKIGAFGTPIPHWTAPTAYAESKGELYGVEKKTGGEVRLERDHVIFFDGKNPQPKTWEKKTQHEGFPVNANPQTLKHAIAHLMHCLTTQGWIPDVDNQRLVVPLGKQTEVEGFFPCMSFNTQAGSLNLSWAMERFLTTNDRIRMGVRII